MPLCRFLTSLFCSPCQCGSERAFYPEMFKVMWWKINSVCVSQEERVIHEFFLHFSVVFVGENRKKHVLYLSLN